jgi:phosphonate transport system substrate-binding protein
MGEIGKRLLALAMLWLVGVAMVHAGPSGDEQNALASTEPEPLIVGIFPRRNATQTVTLFRPMLDHLAAHLERPVELVTARDFPSFWEGVEARRFDLVHFNQYQYIKSHAEHGYDAILSNQEFGEDKIAGAIYVRKDSGIDQVAQLRGRNIVFGGGRSAMMSYIIPADLLLAAGLKPGDYQETFAISPPNSVFSVYFEQADAAGAGEVVWNLPLVKGRIDPEQLQQIAVSERVQHLPWAVRRELDSALKKSIVETLGNLENSDAGRKILATAKLTGMRPVSDAAYDAQRDIVFRVLGEKYH